ncbi:gephyrin-like molybdotransferase Glp [Dyadobacter subterraneus]|uniref:Molybdopterin molybdenumtransferase n=1 Tax=Dyadobacter subterraneus TaxID=2773304 RepID=A0ABR9WHL9_9BACT|nr:gephyrin-like molybdotransferase Glp [Dyadobacter subterraneus]MBE9464990.1 molybdopterin molybdotransferase MoeA [Dyadobacter subterraneus]
MVTVAEAKRRITENTIALSTEVKTVQEASGYVLAKDVLATFSLPSFRQSSMDGYAVLHTDITNENISLPVVSESKAGGTSKLSLEPGTAIRIFTGAPVPAGATAVIMQERTSVENGVVMIKEFPVAENLNVRNVGQQIREGDIALSAASYLSAGAIGFLTGLNVQEVEVFRKPKIGILVTGDELVKTGEELGDGQVYESNSAMLVAALTKEGINDVEVFYAQDDLTSTINSLELLAIRNDVVIATGGVSVGDYDYVGKALESIEAETIFYKVRQKPGKPLLFAKTKGNHFYALPGNPASSLVCFYEYVLPALRLMSGRNDNFLPSFKLPISHAYSFNGERDEFLKASVSNAQVTSLEGQESFALRSFAVANALIYLPVTQQNVYAGDLVEVHLLPL